MDENKNKAVVRIAGSEYTIASTEPEEYIQRVALYVDKKMTALAERDKRLSTVLAAILASVNIADEFFKCQEYCENLQKEIKRSKAEIEEKTSAIEKLQRENGNLKDEIQEMKIEIAKLETELKQYRKNEKA